ncbi:MAG: hypothetical protein JSW26_14035 [Desulfobacterales bacterium]|nr:MAG: hypothetical protein JSW26_14035 [Desulfobacterales bacterium]
MEGDIKTDQIQCRKKEGFILRAMTHNIHSCVGMDNEVNLERIARVIGDSAPDVVAL